MHGEKHKKQCFEVGETAVSPEFSEEKPNCFSIDVTADGVAPLWMADWMQANAATK